MVDTTPLTQDMFETKRTFQAFHKLEADLEMFLSYGDKDRHAAVQAALHKLAAVLCESIGQLNSAAVIHQRYNQLVPLALRAIEPSARRGKMVGRLAATATPMELIAPPAPNPSAVAPTPAPVASAPVETALAPSPAPVMEAPAAEPVRFPKRRPGRPRKDAPPPEKPKKNWHGPIPQQVLKYLKKSKKVGGRPPLEVGAWLKAHPAAWDMVT